MTAPESERSHVLDDDDDPLEIEVEVEDKEEYALATDLVLALVKAVTMTRYYPADNPLVTKFRRELTTKFAIYLAQYSSLILQITETEIIGNRHVLHQDADLQTSLPFLLYNDGLRELRFSAGLVEWEINELVTVINQSNEVNPLEDDLVILLWEKEFIHIDYLAVDDFLEEATMAPENVEEYRARLTRQTSLVPSGSAYWSEDTLQNAPDAGADTESGPLELTALQRSYMLTPDELLALEKEVDVEISPDFVFNTADIIFDMFALEQDEESFQNAADVLVRIIDAQITLGEFARASELLQRIHDELAIPGLHYWQTTIIRQLLISLGDHERIERIGRMLHRADSMQIDIVAGYLRHLPSIAIPPLIVVLEILPLPRMRGMLCDVLAEIGKNSYEKFLPALKSTHWFLVRNIAYILGRVGNPRAIPNLAAAFAHKDYRVRREIAHSLGLIGGDSAINTLIKALADEHEEVRNSAALSLGRIHTANAVTALLRQLRERAFRAKETSEVCAIFDAIGQTHADEALDPLRQLLERHNWFGGARAEELRGYAARALAACGTPAALAVLESGCQHRHPAIRQVCAQALGR